MIHSLLHGKLPTSMTRSEDVATSTIFGLLRYLPWRVGLGPWLSLARRVDGVRLVAEHPCEMTFWPSLSYNDSTVEPDVILRPTRPADPTILVECKLWSGPSGKPSTQEDKEISGQLGRQWLALHHRVHGPTAAPANEATPEGVVLYVTSDPVMPGPTLRAMIDEIEKNGAHKGLREHLYWLSWRSLDRALGQPDDERDELITGDLRSCLKRYGFVACGPTPPPSSTQVPWSFSNRPVGARTP